MILRNLFFGPSSQTASHCNHAQDSPCCMVPVRVCTKLLSGEEFYKCVNCGKRVQL